MTKRTIFAIAVVLIALVAYYFASEYLTFDALKASTGKLQEYVAQNYVQAALGYIALYVVAVMFSLPIAALLTLAGGFMFGAFYGGLFAVIGATLGAALCFLGVRYLVGAYVQKRYEKHLAQLNAELDKRGAYYLLSLRFFAVIPFFVINLVSGLSRIPLSTFIITTVLGIIPGAFVYAYAGQNLATLESPSDILSFKVLVSFALLGVLALLPILFQKLRQPSPEPNHSKETL